MSSISNSHPVGELDVAEAFISILARRPEMSPATLVSSVLRSCTRLWLASGPTTDEIEGSLPLLRFVQAQCETLESLSDEEYAEFGDFDDDDTVWEFET